jgi:hypothetical protein
MYEHPICDAGGRSALMIEPARPGAVVDPLVRRFPLPALNEAPVVEVEMLDRLGSTCLVPIVEGP